MADDSGLKYLFGKPYEGNHAARLVLPFGGPDLAAVDLAFTFAGALAIALASSYYRSKKIESGIAMKTLWTFGVLWLVGMAAHWAVGLRYGSDATGLFRWAYQNTGVFVNNYALAAAIIATLAAVSIDFLLDRFVLSPPKQKSA